MGLPLVADLDMGYHSVVVVATDSQGLGASNAINLYVNSSAFVHFTHRSVSPTCLARMDVPPPPHPHTHTLCLEFQGCQFDPACLDLLSLWFFCLLSCRSFCRIIFCF